MIKFKKIEHDPRKYFPKLIEMLKKDKDITAAYLFGSYASGNIAPLSDVDIAILLDKKFPKDKYFDKQLDLIGEVAHILRTDEVDLVILNQAPVTFSYSIVSDSKIMYCANPHKRIHFETTTMLKYLDTKKIRDEYFFYLHKRIKEGTYGVKLEKHRASLKQTARLFRSS